MPLHDFTLSGNPYAALAGEGVRTNLTAWFARIHALPGYIDMPGL